MSKDEVLHIVLIFCGYYISFGIFLLFQMNLDIEGFALLWIIVPIIAMLFLEVLQKLKLFSYNLRAVAISLITIFIFALLISSNIHKEPVDGEFIPDITYLIFLPSWFIFSVIVFIRLIIERHHKQRLS